jgi:hypothetical protein
MKPADPPEDDEPLLTRDQAYELLRKHGYPLGRSTLDKMCSPCVNQGPPVTAWWPGRGGDRPLYRPRDVLAWAQTLLKPNVVLAAKVRLTQPAAPKSAV